MMALTSGLTHNILPLCKDVSLSIRLAGS
jgi:hypothetical protein